jgi:Ca2+-binding EF-hand superfamily protein
VEDALSANAPHIRKIKSCGYNYILGVKPRDHKYLFNWIDALDNDDIKTHSFYRLIGQKVKKRITYKFKWRNEVPLNDSNNDLLVNFLDFKEIIETLDKNGEVIESKTKISPWTWVTDIKITKDNVYQIMRGGRARWRIENEVFNTLKNQGYNLEHNFGHGFKNLCNNFIMLMMLAFLVDQLQEIACSTFKKALITAQKKIFMGRYKRTV